MNYENTYCHNTEKNIERYHKAGWHHIDSLDKGTMYVKACMLLGREVCFLTDDPIYAVKIDDVDPVNYRYVNFTEVYNKAGACIKEDLRYTVKLPLLKDPIGCLVMNIDGIDKDIIKLAPDSKPFLVSVLTDNNERVTTHIDNLSYLEVETISLLNIELGQIVWDLRYGDGYVVEVDENKHFCYDVRFEDANKYASFNKEGIDNTKVRTLFTENKTNYYSERGMQLIYIGSPADKPIITVENYTKWYNLYKIDTDGTVTKITDDYPDWLDHCPIPSSVLTYAKEKNWYIDEQSIEMIIGRLIKEKPETLELKDMFDIVNYDYIYQK